jgi:hypothetical protein
MKCRGLPIHLVVQHLLMPSPDTIKHGEKCCLRLSKSAIIQQNVQSIEYILTNTVKIVTFARMTKLICENIQKSLRTYGKMHS